MCAILSVRWTVIPRIPPQPWIKCTGCGGFSPFASSGKARLNANGKTLDAWLVYKCTRCDGTWNRPIFERRNIGAIDPAVLAALHTNDPHWVRAQAFDRETLRRHAQRIDDCEEVDVHKRVIAGERDDCATLEIALAIPHVTALRLDRLLATELGIARSRLQPLLEQGRLRTMPAMKHALRRPLADGLGVVIDGMHDLDRTRSFLPHVSTILPPHQEADCISWRRDAVRANSKPWSPSG